jgi:hypothetical protein
MINKIYQKSILNNCLHTCNHCLIFWVLIYVLILYFRSEGYFRQTPLFFDEYNSNSKIAMSSVPDRKFHSILKRIPVETIFDVLKFLTYEQWFALQFLNWRLAEIIEKNVNYLAFPMLHSIFFRVRAKYYLNN